MFYLFRLFHPASFPSYCQCHSFRFYRNHYRIKLPKFLGTLHRIKNIFFPAFIHLWRTLWYSADLQHNKRFPTISTIIYKKQVEPMRNLCFIAYCILLFLFLICNLHIFREVLQHLLFQRKILFRIILLWCSAYGLSQRSSICVYHVTSLL